MVQFGVWLGWLVLWWHSDVGLLDWKTCITLQLRNCCITALLTSAELLFYLIGSDTKKKKSP